MRISHGSMGQRSRAATWQTATRRVPQRQAQATTGLLSLPYAIRVRIAHLLACRADRTAIDFERNMRIAQSLDEHPVLALMRAGMVACTPGVPVVAISVGILDLYYRLRRHAPRLGVQPFVRALCDKYMVRIFRLFLGRD